MRIPNKKIIEFLKQQRHVDDVISLCVLVRDEFGIELTIAQGEELFKQL